MKKQFGEYFLGLDMGTNSVGWAVTDEEYHLQKFNGKQMWGIHLFESGKTAADRRMARTARRRRDRQVQRIKLLQELFSEEITKKDPGFFLRLKESFFLQEDKTVSQKYTLFNDKDFSDKDYHKKYPTIYHLRLAFINGEPIHDSRLLYLAVAHIIKNRGHFLFDSFDTDNLGKSFQKNFTDMAETLSEVLDMSISVGDPQIIESILRNTEIKNNEKVKRLMEEIQSDNDEALKEVLILLTGGKASLSKIFNDNTFEDTKFKKISLSDLENENESAEDESLEDILQDKIIVPQSVKAIADWLTLADLLQGMRNLSEAKVFSYNKHKYDLRLLKQAIRKFAPDQYNSVFTDPDKENNYSAYIRMTKKNGKKQLVSANSCTQSDFCKSIYKIISAFPQKGKNIQYLLQETSNGRLLPRQKNKENSVIPNQLHEKELAIILKNAEQFFPFLLNKDEDGYTVSEKIKMLLTFRIPYYIGPLNDAHKETSGHCWIVRKENVTGLIRPWNFEKKVDRDKSAEQFIRKMTNKCTYLVGEDVLPKNSLLYTKYMVLDELNNLRLNGEKPSPEIKMKMFNELFLEQYHITEKKLRDYLLSEGLIQKDTEISGIDGDFKASLKPWIDFKHILNNRRFDESLIEEIIENITLFSGTDILINRLKTLCAGKYSENEIKKFSKLKYKDWGRFSRKFLTGIYHIDKATGECHNFITMLEITNCNHMELLSSNYDFQNKIRQFNQEINGLNREITYDRVKDLYVSPAVRRSIWRTLCIVKEIRKIMGHDPKKVFIEVPRGEGEKKRTITRKKQIEKLYQKCKDITPELIETLKLKNDNDLKNDQLFLYFIQKGKCAYTGEKIDLSLLFDKNIYNIDHIYPRSLTKDDSVLNNKVLCLKTVNEDKGDNYPIKPEIQQKMIPFWRILKDQNLITTEKYNRLVRGTPLTYEELGNFISRQIVETGQACKAAAEILREVFPDSAIVYSKPGNVDHFRQQFDLVKVRSLNDLHHAKDAYLNIVVGNIFDTKFTRDPRNFFKQHDHNYNLEKIFDYDVSRNGYHAWIAPNKKNGAGTLDLVKKTYNKNNILFTRYSYSKSGKFYKITPLKKGKGEFPLKTSDSRFSKTDNNGKLIYGGYTEISGSYAFLVEHKKRKKIIRSVEFVWGYCKERIDKEVLTLENYAKTFLGLESPRILIDKINIDSLLIFDDFPVHLSGRKGNYLLVKSASQFYLSLEDLKYFKNISKFYDDQKQKESLLISEKSGITREKNLEFFNTVKEKYNSDPYKNMFSSYVTLMENGKNKFESLCVEDQCLILYKLVKLSRCNSVREDLSEINGSKETGRISRLKDLSNFKQVILVNQSVTGLFEKFVDLKTL